MLISLVFVSTAFAYRSETQHFELSDRAEFYTDAEYDTDWLPADSPLAVRFQIVADGGAGVMMEGDGDLEWPDVLTLFFTGDPGTGVILNDASLSAVTSVKFDVYGYAWESEIDNRGIDISAQAEFDPFLMDGANPDSVTVDFSGFEDELISYSYNVFTGVALEFAADIHPESETTFSGVAWWVGDDSVEEEGGSALVDLTGDPTELVDSTFVGAWSSYLDLVLTPSMSVCVDLIGCYELVAFDIPINVASDDFEQAFPPITLEFPVPVLTTQVDAYDFGQVEVGQIADLQVPVGDAGALAVEGDAGILGSDWFTVYPGYYYAAPGQEDGVMVTFAPLAEGPVQATLMLESNDPLHPLYEVTLTGEGVLPPEIDAVDDSGAAADDEEITGHVHGCGCASTGHGRLEWLALLPLGGLLLMRRRRFLG